jgi:hypothetical protein
MEEMWLAIGLLPADMNEEAICLEKIKNIKSLPLAGIIFLIQI